MAVNGTAETAPTPVVSLRVPTKHQSHHQTKFRERPDAWRVLIAPHKSGLSLHLPKLPPVHPLTPPATDTLASLACPPTGSLATRDNRAVAVNGTAETAPTPVVSLRVPTKPLTNHPTKTHTFPHSHPQTPTTTPLNRRVAYPSHRAKPCLSAWNSLAPLHRARLFQTQAGFALCAPRGVKGDR